MATPNPFYTVDTYQVERGVGFLAEQFSRTVSRELDRRMADLGLTDAQWKPLLVLRQRGRTTAAELSRIGGHDAGSVTRLLDRLEAKGFVQRVRSAKDRRVVDLELTAEGKKIAEQIPEIIVGLANETLRGFSRDEFEQFADLLTRAAANARSIIDTSQS